MPIYSFLQAPLYVKNITKIREIILCNIKRVILYSKLPPCSEYCILSFGWYPGVRILFTDRLFGNVNTKKFRRRKLTHKKEKANEIMAYFFYIIK